MSSQGGRLHRKHWLAHKPWQFRQYWFYHEHVTQGCQWWNQLHKASLIVYEWTVQFALWEKVKSLQRQLQGPLNQKYFVQNILRDWSLWAQADQRCNPGATAFQQDWSWVNTLQLWRPLYLFNILWPNRCLWANSKTTLRQRRIQSGRGYQWKWCRVQVS